MATTPKQRKRLDVALENFQVSFEALSKKVKTAIDHLDTDDYTFPDLTRATKQHAETLKILIDAAPFFAAKQSLEAADHMREWVLHSADYAGERREFALALIQAYESAILADSGFLEREQYQLL